ncbi:MAG: hypothetical protein AAGB00_04870 [Planctomycetota bacterium]
MPLRSTLTLALLSGAAALSHELLWTRRLIDLLGATGEATSRVFGCFFLGLAIGALVAARVLPRVKSPWLAIAACEVAIALLSAPAMTLPWWSDWVWPALGPGLLVGWAGAATKTVLSVAVVLPPTIPMGMTLPFFTAALLHDRGTLSRQGVLLYGFNTLGGVVGLLVTSLVLLTSLGVVGSMATVAAVNLAIGGLAWRWHAAGQGVAAPSTANTAPGRDRRDRRRSRQSAPTTPLGRRSAMLLAFASGLAMLVLEVLSIRLLGLVVPSSLQATVAVLVAVILLLAAAAIAFPLLLRVNPQPKTWLLFTLSGAAVSASLTPWLFFRGSGQLWQLALPGGRTPATSVEFMWAVCLLALSTIGPAILLGGMVLPTVFAWVGSDQGDRRGKDLGYLLAANGVGGILGAEATDLLVLPRFGIYGGFCAVGVLYAAAAALVLQPWIEWKLSRVIATSIVFVAPLGTWWLIASRVPYLNPKVAKTFAYDDANTRFGRDGVLLIVKRADDSRGILVNNQYLLGSTGSRRDERREVLLPMLLHEKPERVLCVGLATGISAGAALDYSEPCELTAVEISQMVKTAATDHFGEFNGRLGEAPNVDLVVEDGRTYVAATTDRFDVIVGDLYRPYGAGEGRLYSVEHFRATRRALRGGGLFCQWLPMYQMTEEHFGIVAASFLQAYPDGELIRANHNAKNPMLGLLGTKNGPLDLTGLARRTAALESVGRVADSDLLSPEKLRDFYVGRLDAGYFQNHRLNTLDNALVELLAGQRRVTQRPQGPAAAGQDPYLKRRDWERFERRLSKMIID